MKDTPDQSFDAQQLLQLLCTAASLPEEDFHTGVLRALGALHGVLEARFMAGLPVGEDMQDARWLCLPLGAGSADGALCLRAQSAALWEAHGTALRHFATALAHVREARRLRTCAQQAQAQAQALQRSEKRFRDLFENSPDPCWLIENGVFIDCNRAAIHMLGYTRREDILQHPSRLSPEKQPDGRLSFEKAEELMQRALQEGMVRFEWEHCRADGTFLSVEVTLARLELQGHAVLYCVWRDVTDRKRAEVALRERDDKAHLAYVLNEACPAAVRCSTVCSRAWRPARAAASTGLCCTSTWTTSRTSTTRAATRWVTACWSK